MANEFKVRKGLIVQGSGSNIFDVQGSQGQLFSITDSLVGSLFSVNDISGIPIMEVFSDNTIKMGTFNREAIIVSGSRTGMGIATPQAKLHISGANNDSLFRIQSLASASIMFVSGSGLVGIGTATPTQKISVDNGNVGFTSGFGISWDSDTEWIRRAAASDQLQFATQNTVRLNIGSTQGQLVAIGLGATTPSAQFQVRGGGATAATTAMRIEDSGGNARLTILDDGTSAFNTSHLYISSSGRVAIGTLTPQRLFDVYNGSTSGIIASFGAQISNNNFSGISFGYVEQANALFRKSALVFERTETQGGGANASGKIHFLLNNNSSTSATALTDAVLTIDSVGTTVGSSRVGIGTRFPTASLHISGTVATDNLMRVQSTTGAEYFFISASGNIGIGLTSPLAKLHISGANSLRMQNTGFDTFEWFFSAGTGIGFRNVTDGTTPFFVGGTDDIGIGTTNTSAKLHISGASNAGLLEIDSPAVNNIIYVSGSGNIGIGTNLPSADLHISGASADSLLRVGSPTNANILFVTGSGRVGIGTSTPSQLFEVVRSGNSKIVAGDNVGIQTATASEWIHLSSDPSTSKYLRIDATQTSNGPQQTPVPGTFNYVAGPGTDDAVLGLPNFFMEIKLDGTIVLIPCYVPQ
jgi:hypothetical protein